MGPRSAHICHKGNQKIWRQHILELYIEPNKLVYSRKDEEVEIKGYFQDSFCSYLQRVFFFFFLSVYEKKASDLAGEVIKLIKCIRPKGLWTGSIELDGHMHEGWMNKTSPYILLKKKHSQSQVMGKCNLCIWDKNVIQRFRSLQIYHGSFRLYMRPKK